MNYFKSYTIFYLFCIPSTIKLIDVIKDTNILLYILLFIENLLLRFRNFKIAILFA
nr:MAG TPA: hypothetical protein [Crassvirales sp.]